MRPHRRLAIFILLLGLRRALASASTAPLFILILNHSLSIRLRRRMCLSGLRGSCLGHSECLVKLFLLISREIVEALSNSQVL